MRDGERTREPGEEKTEGRGKRQREGSHDGDGVVIEDGGDIFRGELVGGVADEQTCLSDSTVADDDAPAEGWGVSM